jgi:hypothetical protein
MNAGVALVDAGRADAALPRFDEAARAFDAAGVPDMALEARYNRAAALARTARLGEAVRDLAALVDEHEARGLVRRAALCRWDLAEALLRAGDRVSSARSAERAAADFARVGAAAERSEALLLAATAEPSRALADATLRRAKAAALAAGREGVALRCDLQAERARFARRGRAAEEACLRVARRAQALRQADVAAQARILLAESAIAGGRIARAEAHLAVASRASGGRPWVRAAVESGRATCLARRGRSREALDALRRAAGFFDAVRADLPGAWLRSAFLASRLDPYLSRVEMLLERGAAADRAEAEAVLEALASRRFLERAPPRAPKGPLDRIRRRLHVLYDRLGRGGGAGGANGSDGSGGVRGPDAAGLMLMQRVARDLERRAAEEWKTAERTTGPGPAVETAQPRSAWLAPEEAAVYAWVWSGRMFTLVRRGWDVVDARDAGPVDEVDRLALRVRFHADRLRLFSPATEAGPFRTALDALSNRLLGPMPRFEDARCVHLVVDPETPDVPWEFLPFRCRH